MAELPIRFDDSAAYERAIGRWSRAVAPIFIQWLAPPASAHWLDVGCGGGVLAQTVLELCSRATVVGVDPEVAQIAQATQAPTEGRASFQVADACKLPFRDGSFDIVAAGLVLNFIAEPSQAMAEMHRVARCGGSVAAYIWDFADELSPSGPLRRSLRRLGVNVAAIPGTAVSRIEAMRILFEHEALERIETRTIDVCLAYKDFQDFWQAQTPDYSPTTKVIASMTEGERTRLMRTVRAELPSAPGGVIEYFARANAIKARVPRS